LLLDENQDLRESLAIKKKRNKHGKRLDMRRESEYYGGAEWWSPRSFKHAGERQAQRKQEKRRKTSGKQTWRNLKLLMRYSRKNFKRRGALRERLKKDR
jgi:hypothetical protein